MVKLSCGERETVVRRTPLPTINCVPAVYRLFERTGPGVQEPLAAPRSCCCRASRRWKPLSGDDSRVCAAAASSVDQARGSSACQTGLST
jgi:hypothetical protein